MANNLDQLNYYDPLIEGKRDKMSDVWISNMSAFVQTLQGYLSQFGMFLPQVTTDQRNSIQSPVNGQVIYNTTTGTAEYFKAGVWTPF
jgi:hypothetical protein